MLYPLHFCLQTNNDFNAFKCHFFRILTFIYSLSAVKIVLTLYLSAKSITVATFSIGALGEGDKVTVLPLKDRIFFCKDLVFTFRPLILKTPRESITTSVNFSFDGGVCDLELPGILKFSALGETKEDVNIKNINNRKMMSVKDDILNSALTLLFFFSPNG